MPYSHILPYSLKSMCGWQSNGKNSFKIIPALLLLFLRLLSWSSPEFRVSFHQIVGTSFLYLHKFVEKSYVFWAFVQIVLGNFKKLKLLLGIFVLGNVREDELLFEQ
jgi:hypothetical protein